MAEKLGLFNSDSKCKYSFNKIFWRQSIAITTKIHWATQCGKTIEWLIHVIRLSLLCETTKDLNDFKKRKKCQWYLKLLTSVNGIKIK